jgi:hypothetical protein
VDLAAEAVVGEDFLLAEAAEILVYQILEHPQKVMQQQAAVKAEHLHVQEHLKQKAVEKKPQRPLLHLQQSKL